MGISNNLGFIANVNTFPASGRSAGYELISSQQDYGLNLYSQTTDGGAEVTGIIAFAMSGAELDLTNTKINMSIRSPWRTIGPLYNTVDANISTIASLNSVNNPTARYTFNMFNNSTGSMGLCDGLSFFNFGAPVLDQEWHDITFQFSTGIVAGTGIGN